MKNKILSLVVLTAIATSVAVGQTSTVLEQPEFAKILLQPEDQLVPIGSNATFTVQAINADGYQWFHNGNPITGGTNSSLTISNATVNDVGYYSCEVFKGFEGVPARAASLQVFTSSIDPQTGVDPITVFGFPLPGGGSQGSCPGHYVGYVNYTKTVQQGWGWAPDTTNGNTIFTATDTNRTDTKIQFGGAYGDNSCNQTTVTVVNPPGSPVYRSAIYFTNNVPTNAYAITLDGFKP